MTTITDPESMATEIMGRLTGHARDDARLWSSRGKCRIYFARACIELYADGSVDVGSNPYGVSKIVDELGYRVR